jgi:hypothetical protein
MVSVYRCHLVIIFLGKACSSQGFNRLSLNTKQLVIKACNRCWVYTGAMRRLPKPVRRQQTPVRWLNCLDDISNVDRATIYGRTRWQPSLV